VSKEYKDRKLFEGEGGYPRPSSHAFETSLATVGAAIGAAGTAFAVYFEELRNEIAEIRRQCEELRACCEALKPPSAWTLGSGPLHRDLNLRSIVARANNYNNFPVNIKLLINGTSNGVLTPFSCEEKTVPACESVQFSIVDMSTFNFASFTIDWEFLTLDGEKVEKGIRVFAAGRSDLPDVSIESSHLLTTATLYHSNFTVKEASSECFDSRPQE
jgi:hypothetical protein